MSHQYREELKKGGYPKKILNGSCSRKIIPPKAISMYSLLNN